MAELQDFGKKIGGARKDLWAARGLSSSDLSEMNEFERQSHIKRDNIWLKPDWVDLIRKGTPQGVAYWQNRMRLAIPPKPLSDNEAAQKNFVKVVGEIRDAVMAIKEPAEIESFYQDFIRANYFVLHDRGYSHYAEITPEASGIINNKVLNAARGNYRWMEREAKNKLFGIAKEEQAYIKVKNSLSVYLYDGENVVLTPIDDGYHSSMLTVSVPLGRSFYYFHSSEEFADTEKWKTGTYFVMKENCRKPVQINFRSKEEAEAFVESRALEAQERANSLAAETGKTGKRKGAFTPPQLKHIKREGPRYRGIRPADSHLFLHDLKFRGGEFGNWLNKEDRQASLDMAYDALRDLARVLNIRPEDVSLNGKLAIAFGARGRGGANAGAAHYEPARQVINLTKMSGAGCLAHEWGHALDHAIGIASGETGLASEGKPQFPSFQGVLASMRYKWVVLTPEEVYEAELPKIENCKRNLTNWINSVKPTNLSDGAKKTWEETLEKIISSASEFTGGEYLSFGRGDVVKTKPEVELLSQMRKYATNHGISKDTKRQIVMWAADLASHERKAKTAEPTEKRVETDFYKGSVEFDKLYSRASHGYYQSTCEMFARAFDCYIADKLKDAGLRSDYLTAYADSFAVPGPDGKTVAAIPLGEERKEIFEKIDLLITELKEKGLLHDNSEELEMISAEPEPAEDRQRAASEKLAASFGPAMKTEQLSLDELLFSASSRAASCKPGKASPSQDHSR